MSFDLRRLVKNVSKPSTRSASRQAGDLARDQQDWSSAEREYSAHLASVDDDQPIWIQYGHALKEQGKLEDAEKAYQRAIDLKPGDADAHLQLGHALKLLGRRDDAEQAYTASLLLAPSKAAYDEVSGIGAIEVADQVVSANAEQDGSATLYFEIDDLLDYLRSHKTLSGIQRVQVGIIQHAMQMEGDAAVPIAFVRSGKHAAGFWRLRMADLRGIIDYINQARASQDRLRAMIEQAEQHAIRVEPRSGQIYFILGAFWGFGSNAGRYAKLKQAGVKVGVYIYDLIPLTHPEYCAAGLVTEFTLAIGDGLHAFDFIMTISDFVAKAMRAYQAKHGLPPTPVEPILLAHQLHARPTTSYTAKFQGALAPLENRPYVLMVSTIEARKNHMYLYQVWKNLIEDGVDVPDLVFVGRFGWRVNDFHDTLVATEFLGERIHVLHDLSDVELEFLYQNCLFTAFPSIVEGWGLPVGESLAHGKPCIASNTSSIPEVGGDLVDYIDPWNVREGVRVFRQMITDKAYREQRSRAIAERFKPRTWTDVGRNMLERIEVVRAAPATPYMPPLLKAGELLVPGTMWLGTRAPATYVQRPLRPILAESWYPIEQSFAWLRGFSGTIWFRTDCAPGTAIIVYLQLLGAPWVSDHSVAIHAGRGAKKRPAKISFPRLIDERPDSYALQADQTLVYPVEGVVEPDGTVILNLAVTGAIVTTHATRSTDDDRSFYVGLVKLAYAAVDHPHHRVTLLEEFGRAG